MNSDRGRRAAFDPAVLQRLADDLESREVAHAFAMSFRALLPGRIKRIHKALRNQDREEVLVALLSLRASAAMVGAAQLERSATRALAHDPVEATAAGALRRKLEGQAHLFEQAFEEAWDTQIPATTHDGAARNVG